MTRGRRTLALTAAAAIGALTITGCTFSSSTGRAPNAGRHRNIGGHSPGVRRHTVITGRGWTAAAGIQGRIPAPGTCHYRHLAHGELGPDPRCTPGAIDRAVTPGDVSSTICRPGGYTDSVRPPESLTEPMKYRLLAAYGVPASKASDYELDHLIELSAGGSSNVANLWPEPNHDAHHARRSAFVHNDKDQVEDESYDAVCHDGFPLRVAQRLAAHNWVRLAGRLGSRL